MKPSSKSDSKAVASPKPSTPKSKPSSPKSPTKSDSKSDSKSSVDIFEPLSPIYTHPLHKGTIYIGSSLCVNPEILESYKITRLVDVSKTPEKPSDKNTFVFDLSSFNSKRYSTDLGVIEYLTPLLTFLDYSSPYNTLIHCLSGSPRSGTIALIVLMRYLGINDIEEVSKMLKERRPVCEPNEGGWELVKRFWKARENGEDLDLDI